MSDLSKAFVDSHFHVFDAGLAQQQARYVPAYDAPLANWQAAAQPQGVRRGVLVQTSFLGTDNSRLVQELTRNPEMLRGIAVVDPGSSAAELAQLHEAGIRGVRLNLAGGPHDMAPWRGAHELWDALFAMGWHLELHTDVGRLPDVLRQVPADLPLVIDHMGKPGSVCRADPGISALVRRAKHASVHVKLSGAYRLGGRDPMALARLWVDELGVDRLLWGSDWPCTNHESEADYGRLLGALFIWIGRDHAARVLVDNPVRLYWNTRFP